MPHMAKNQTNKKCMANFGSVYQNYNHPDPVSNSSCRYFPMLQNDKVDI